MNSKLLLLPLFLFSSTVLSAPISIINDSSSGGGKISIENGVNENTVSTSHSELLGQFDDTWNINLNEGWTYLSIASSVPKFNDFNVQYSTDDGETWTNFYTVQSSTYVETKISSNTVDNYLLHVYGDASNRVNLSGTYQLSIGQSTVVPIPAAAWLFGSSLAGLSVFCRNRKV